MNEYELQQVIYNYVADNFGESEANDPSWSIAPLAKHIAKHFNDKAACNGWSNYATWRVMLELMSEYIDFEIERIREGDTELLDMSDSALADYLKDYAEEQVDDQMAASGDTLTAVVQGWANAFLEDANWLEIAQNAKETWNEELKTAKESK